jgi:hypothetical protein
MSYTIEKTENGTDIVVSGWEEGIRDNPYEGIYDMRNCDTVTIPGEVSVAMSTQTTYANIPVSGATFTVSASIPVLTIGYLFGGGRVAYILQPGDPGYVADGTQRGFIVSNVDVNASEYWGPGNATGATGVALGTGSSNTTTIIASYGAGTYAASTCHAYAGGGFNDWFLPSENEAYKVYLNRVALGFTGSENIWTSTEVTAGTAYLQPIYGGGSGGALNKADLENVRAMRSFVNNTPVYNIFNWGNTATLTVGTAIMFSNSGGALPTGLLNTQAYYILSIPAPGQFTIGTSVNGSPVICSDAGSGTNTFTVINMGTPVQIIKSLINSKNAYFMYDNNGRIWVYDNSVFSGSNYWYYMNNLYSELSPGQTGNIIYWEGYLFAFTGDAMIGVEYMPISGSSVLSTITLKANWVMDWQAALLGNNHYCMISQTNGFIFFCNKEYVGTLQLQINQTFDPTVQATFKYSDGTSGEGACTLPNNDQSTCLADLGQDLMIGGINSYVYSWNMVTPSPNSDIFLSENYTTRMVTVNTTMYIFCGNKGRIFVTNGANATPFFKVPDYLSGTTNPYFIWTDATFNRNQLYFGFKVTDNSGTVINLMGGLWAVDVDSVQPVSPRLQNIMSYGTYAGYVSAICQYRGSDSTVSPSGDGYGLFMGWYSGTVGGIDIGISNYYTGQSYVDTDPVPIGQYLTKKTLSGIEYKLATPLVTNESVAIAYRTSLSGSYTNNPITDTDSSGLSGWGVPVFEKSQWIQFRITLTGIASGGSNCRLREIRIHTNG